jgi:hypothetical protein
MVTTFISGPRSGQSTRSSSRSSNTSFSSKNNSKGLIQVSGYQSGNKFVSNSTSQNKKSVSITSVRSSAPPVSTSSSQKPVLNRDPSQPSPGSRPAPLNSPGASYKYTRDSLQKVTMTGDASQAQVRPGYVAPQTATATSKPTQGSTDADERNVVSKTTPRNQPVSGVSYLNNQERQNVGLAPKPKLEFTDKNRIVASAGYTPSVGGAATYELARARLTNQYQADTNKITQKEKYMTSMAKPDTTNAEQVSEYNKNVESYNKSIGEYKSRYTPLVREENKRADIANKRCVPLDAPAGKPPVGEEVADLGPIC